MSPNLDQEDDKPLDPAVAEVEQRVRRLILIAGLTLGLGIFAVFAAILYRIVTYDSTPTVTEAQAGDATAEAEAEIRSALAAWNAAFNAADTERICDLFAPDLRYYVRDLPEQTYDDMCGRLKKTLADPARALAYSADIHEVIVTGDSAVVRLTWTLTTRAPGEAPVTGVEQGMDYFERQPDGSWKIARFVSYEE
jgi:steroid delta-isomerase